jgi:Uncharacterized membrane protein, putative virulence factor
MGFKLSMLVGLPSAVGMYLLAKPIILLLYSHGSNGLTTDELSLATQLLQTLAIGVFFLTLLQTMTGILQGAGHQFVPLANLAVGAVVKIVLSIVLIRIPSLNVQGAAIGTAACYGIAALLNVIAMIRYTKPKIRPVSGLLMPLLATAAMGLTAYYLYNRLIESRGNTWACIIAIGAAGVVYLAVLLITGGLRKSDLKEISGRGKPGGNGFGGVE